MRNVTQHPTFELDPFVINLRLHIRKHFVVITVIHAELVLPTRGDFDYDKLSFVVLFCLFADDIDMNIAQVIAAAITAFLKAAFIECSYPNSMMELAHMSKHLTPALLAQELRKLDRGDISVYAYHLKPAYKAQILRELRELSILGLTVLEEDHTLTI